MSPNFSLRDKRMVDCRSDLPVSPHTWYWTFQVPLFYGCLLLLGLMLLSGSAVCFLLVWVLPKAIGMRWGRHLISLTFRSFLAVASGLGLMRLDLSALDALNDEQGLLIAPNHPSMLDVVLVVSRIRQASCIMKSDLWDNIFLGAGARLARYIRNDSVKNMVRLAAAELQAGGKLLMFPEGTRTVRAPVNPLKGGVTLIAQCVQAPIQTVILETNSSYLSKTWPLLRVPAFPMVYRARLGQRFEAPQKAQQTLSTLQNYYESELGRNSLKPRHDSY
jgi:1-acyl-sn-glycerol-3-phosphate acyltransferase